MEISADGLRVIVTAGGQGIGKAIAQIFWENGARVHTCDINAARLAVCREEMPGLTTSVTDVSSVDEVDGMIETAVSKLGGVDVLINNAGIAGPTGPVEEIDIDGWQKTLDVNINSQFYTTRRIIPLMKAQKSGSIINISSTAGLNGYALRSPYTASKWAIIGLTKTWAMELGMDNVRVNVICPGSINGERIDQVISAEAESRGLSEAQVREAYYRQVSMHTFIEAREIAEMAYFLCSPLAAKISGQVLCVDGHTETMRTVY